MNTYRLISVRHRLTRALSATGMATMFMLSTHIACAADTDKTEARQQTEQRLQEAQARFEQSARDVAALNLSMNDGGPRVFISRVGAPRVMLGMNIIQTTDSASNDAGVRVLSVSPGGPADVAGLMANDVITSFDGKALRGDANQSPAQQLLTELRDAKADQAVTVEYRRDGKTLKAQVVPKDAPDVPGALPPLPNLSTPSGVPSEGLRGAFIFNRDLDGFGSAELVELSPTLGKYFGTEKGLLVVRAPQDQRFKLQDGDVLLDIDGRMPTGVTHALQILSSYRMGEKLKLHIMRQQKRIELTIEVPATANKSSSKDFNFLLLRNEV